MTTENQQEQNTNAKRRSVGDWLSRPFIWRVPVYQRHYSWEDSVDESKPLNLFWETVAEQVKARMKGESPDPHYLGAVLVENKTARSSTEKEQIFHVVDGQQRLTTIQIILAAFIESMKGEHKESLREDLKEYFLLDDGKTTKIDPTNFDQMQFRQIVFYAYGIFSAPHVSTDFEEHSKKSKILKAFEFFGAALSVLIRNSTEVRGENIEKIQSAIKETLLNGFELIEIVLKGTDIAQKVFASMNNTSEPLTFFDLIRNDVFYRASGESEGYDQVLFHKDEWQLLEKPYWEESPGEREQKGTQRVTHIETYIARMLVAKLKVAIKFNRPDIFKAYKDFSGKFSSVKEEIDALIEYTGYYRYLAGHGKSGDQMPQNPFGDDFKFGVFVSNVWNNKDFYPLLFIILSSDADINDKQKMLNILESYIIRRMLCNLSPKGYNLFVPTLCKKVDPVRPGSLRAVLAESQADTYRFPADDEVKSSCESNPLYKSNLKSLLYYILAEINNHYHSPGDEVVITSDLTLDHILPQKWETNDKWKKWVEKDVKSQGLDYEHLKNLINAVIDTIGNLTIMSKTRNIGKSNNAFQDVVGSLNDSTIKMNRDIAKLPGWNQNSIIERSRKLAEIICERWPYDLDSD